VPAISMCAPGCLVRSGVCGGEVGAGALLVGVEGEREPPQLDASPACRQMEQVRRATEVGGRPRRWKRWAARRRPARCRRKKDGGGPWADVPATPRPLVLYLQGVVVPLLMEEKHGRSLPRTGYGAVGEVTGGEPLCACFGATTGGRAGATASLPPWGPRRPPPRDYRRWIEAAGESGETEETGWRKQSSGEEKRKRERERGVREGSWREGNKI
jgi:hypothetical protein